MTIEEAIQKSGTKNIVAKGSTKKAQEMIQPDEEILYAINTNVLVEDNKKTIISNGNKGLFSIRNAINGVVAITDKRVLFCSSIIGNVNQKQILIKDITSIEENINGLTKMGQIRIKGITESFTINIYKPKLADEIKNSIHIAQNKVQTTNQTITNSTLSNADEILKYKKLLDEGIITQEEFERKKEQLLK